MSRVMRYPGNGQFYGGVTRRQRFEQYPISPYGNLPTFSPAQLSNLVQRFLDANPTYHNTLLQSLPIITPEEPGTVAVPRGQRCALFDGTNDYASVADSRSGVTAGVVCFWVKDNGSSVGARYLSIGNGTNRGLEIRKTASGFDVRMASTAGDLTTYSSPATTLTNWNHIAIAHSGATVKAYVNGVEVSLSAAATNGGFSGTIINTSIFVIGSLDSVNGSFSSCCIRDVRYYSIIKSAGEIAAIYNQASTPSTIDTTGLLGMWPLQEESGTTAYDVANPPVSAKNLTLTNITQGAFHATDLGVTWNYNNWKGYTLSGSVVIPASLSTPSQDAAGNALGVAGPVAHPVTMEVNCFTGDGSAAYCDLGSALIPATADFSLSFWYYHVANNTTISTVLSQREATLPSGRMNIDANTSSGVGTAGSVSMFFNDGTSKFINLPSALTAGAWHYFTLARVATTVTLTCTKAGGATLSGFLTTSAAFYTGRNTWLMRSEASISPAYNDGRIAGLSITTGGVTKYPLFDQCGPGSSNTNRDFYIMGSDGSATLVSGGIVNGTIANIYANRCPYVKDWAIQYGGGIAANGSFIPGRIGSANDAAGNAKTLTAGKHGNPYSRLVPNYWSAPELVNIGYPSSVRLAPSTTVQATSPADTKFARIKAAGSDRYFATLAALTGSNKTNAQNYVG